MGGTKAKERGTGTGNGGTSNGEQPPKERGTKGNGHELAGNHADQSGTKKAKKSGRSLQIANPPP